MTAVDTEPTLADRRRRVEETIRRVVDAKRVDLPDGGAFEIKNCISAPEGEWLADLVARANPRRTVETGMGTGLSGLHIGLGLLRAAERHGTPPGRHLAIDPCQQGDFWRGAGLAVRDQAGLADLFDHAGEPAEYVLPRMAAAGERVEFAFIDAYHRFENALLEFFYVDRMLPVGGLCVIDDTDWPSVWRVVRFALTHRGYEWVDALAVDQGPLTRPWGWRLRARRWRQFRRQGWSGWDALTRRPYQAVALRKVQADDRAEDFWAPL
ncbi:MAG: class I SAM-dependent methyltransferase [Gemmataceae bacterium]